jgi:hypothetical protein
VKYTQEYDIEYTQDNETQDHPSIQTRVCLPSRIHKLCIRI